MYRISELAKRHRETYRDYSSKELAPFWLPKAWQAASALAIAVFFHSLTDEFLQSVLTVYTILIGFSFSVLFNLIAQRDAHRDEKHESLEAQLRAERIAEVHQEIFYNVSYFILSSLILIAAIVVFYVFTSNSFASWGFVGSLKFPVVLAKLAETIFNVGFSSVLFFLLLETSTLFVRIVGRVIFYFQQKIEHNI